MNAVSQTDQKPTLILGGGLMGLAVAHQLARRGTSVRVISRKRSEAAGFVAAGMLAPHAEGLSGALLKLGQDSLELIPRWVAQIEVDTLINKRGTTFRQLDDATKDAIKELDRVTAKAVMLDNPSVIKRPVLEHNGQYLVGFKAEQYQAFV